jgi:hypothetical protein
MSFQRSTFSVIGIVAKVEKVFEIKKSKRKKTPALGF